MVAQSVDLDDIGVAKPGHRLGFRQKAAGELGPVRLPGSVIFRATEATEPGLSGLVDDTHPAAAQLGQNLDARDVQHEAPRGLWAEPDVGQFGAVPEAVSRSSP